MKNFFLFLSVILTHILCVNCDDIRSKNNSGLDSIRIIVSEIKKRHPDCAVTLSMGERSRSSYQALYDAGADRYLLRHESHNASEGHEGGEGFSR